MFSFLATGIKKYYDIGETLGKGSFGTLMMLSPGSCWARARACADRTVRARVRCSKLRARLAAQTQTPQP